MNFILKDTDFIITCTSMGVRSFLKNSENRIWLSQFTILDFTNREKFIVQQLIENSIVNIYNFNDEDIVRVFKLYNKYKDVVTVSDVSTIIMAKTIEDSVIINGNGIFKSICLKQKIEHYDFNWFFENIRKS